MILTLACLTFACLALAPAAEARSWGRSDTNKPPYALVGFYGVASYAMDDLNHYIDLGNEASGGDYMDPIDGGTEFGFRLLVPITWELSLGFGYTSMMASTRLDPLPGSSDYTEIDARGNSFEISLDFRKDLGEKFGWGAGLSLNRFKADGHSLGVWNGEYYEYEFRGDGWGPVIRVNGDMRLARGVFLWLEGGYRNAETGTVEHHGYDWVTIDGQPMTFSYTGGFVRLGLRTTSLLLD